MRCSWGWHRAVPGPVPVAHHRPYAAVGEVQRDRAAEDPGADHHDRACLVPFRDGWERPRGRAGAQARPTRRMAVPSRSRIETMPITCPPRSLTTGRCRHSYSNMVEATSWTSASRRTAAGASVM